MVFGKMDEHRYFNIAKEVSKMSDFKGIKKVKIGAVLVYKNRIISSAFNSCKTSPIQKRLNIYRGFNPEDGFPTLHAEANAILKCRERIDWSKAKLFVYREYANGNLAPSKPCDGCMKLIREKGIRHIYYTGNDSYCHEELVY